MSNGQVGFKRVSHRLWFLISTFDKKTTQKQNMAGGNEEKKKQEPPTGPAAEEQIEHATMVGAR
jgi:hypothetical protein